MDRSIAILAAQASRWRMTQLEFQDGSNNWTLELVLGLLE